MAHFAKVENGVVTDVIVAEQEFINSGAVGDPSVWVQTSYNGSMRSVYAGIGYLYIEHLDTFVPPQPFPSWTLDDTTAEWKAPLAYPTDGKNYVWNESKQLWEEAINVLPGV